MCLFVLLRLRCDYKQCQSGGSSLVHSACRLCLDLCAGIEFRPYCCDDGVLCDSLGISSDVEPVH